MPTTPIKSRCLDSLSPGLPSGWPEMSSLRGTTESRLHLVVAGPRRGLAGERSGYSPRDFPGCLERGCLEHSDIQKPRSHHGCVTQLRSSRTEPGQAEGGTLPAIPVVRLGGARVGMCLRGRAPTLCPGRKTDSSLRKIQLSGPLETAQTQPLLCPFVSEYPCLRP